MKQALMAQGISEAVATQLAERACEPAVTRATRSVKKKVKRKVSSHSRKYSAAFKKIKGKYMTKAGKWKKNGFKRAVKEAHRMARK